jgi:flagellar biosynthesis protein FlhA
MAAGARVSKLPFGMDRYSDLTVSVGAVLVVAMMVIPLPAAVVDVLLTVNICLTLTVMLVTMYVRQPLEFSVFPSLLLVATLFRLALNISATRLVLLHAQAGQVIASFGAVVVGGNYVVGLVVFLILVVIQFVVITNGAGRVAEVAARFTLDAMPGKQMAIDADLNAGLIDEAEARTRRRTIAQEADFYGAMDGAAKFVRGDAIAAIVIIIVNILGGFVIGVVQRQMDLFTAMQTYTLLTVGEGLVTQIPALLMSTAAGLIVTRAASDHHLGDDLTRQVFSQPRALWVVAGLLFAMTAVPGLPKAPFFVVAALAAGLGWAMHQGARRPAEPPAPTTVSKEPEDVTALLEVDPLELEIGYGLIPLADPKQGGDLLERITGVRRQVALDLGIVVPPLRVRDNVQLRPNAYAVKLRGVEMAQGEIFPRQLLAISSTPQPPALPGRETREPAFGLPALWIGEAHRPDAEGAGCTVVDAATVLITHLSETVRRQAAELLSRQDVQHLLDNAKSRAPAVVEELTSKGIGAGDVQKVLQNLLRERVSIRDLHTILEAIADYAGATKDPDQLSEYARQALGRALIAQYRGADGVLQVITVDPGVEESLVAGLRDTPSGKQLVIEPSHAEAIIAAAREQADRAAGLGHQPVALCSPGARLLFRRLTEAALPTMAVLSHAEINLGTEIKVIGMVTVRDAVGAQVMPEAPE